MVSLGDASGAGRGGRSNFRISGLPLSAVGAQSVGDKELVIVGSEDSALTLFSPSVGAQLAKSLASLLSHGLGRKLVCADLKH